MPTRDQGGRDTEVKGCGRLARAMIGVVLLLAACGPGGGLSNEEHSWCQQNFGRVSEMAASQGNGGVVHADPASPVYVEACKAAYAAR